MWDLSVLDDVTLRQLQAPHYTYDLKMRVQVEPKADTVERIGRSPDDADALLLAFAPIAAGKSKNTARARTRSIR